jgi:hypothetical protein
MDALAALMRQAEKNAVIVGDFNLPNKTGRKAKQQVHRWLSS